MLSKSNKGCADFLIKGRVLLLTGLMGGCCSLGGSFMGVREDKAMLGPHSQGSIGALDGGSPMSHVDLKKMATSPVIISAFYMSILN